MPVAKKIAERPLPAKFNRLAALLPPQAIRSEPQRRTTVEMIDRLMRIKKLTNGQAIYLETLVQLVEAYEAERCPIEVGDLGGLDSLRHLMAENGMNASDLARLLGAHVSMGSKILRGERSLTLEHVRRLVDHFRVGPALFIG